MKFEIKSRWTGSVLFSVETETLKLAVELGVQSGADLRGADLRVADLGGANLYGADLYGVDLRVADLRDSKFPIQILGHRHFLQTTADGKLQIGCHTHTLDRWIKNAEKIGEVEGYSSLDIEIYKLHIKHIAKVARLLWKREGE